MSEQYIACRNGPIGCPFARLVETKEQGKIDIWKEQLSREYKETKDRYERIHACNVRCKATMDTSLYDMRVSKTRTDEDLLFKQEKVMREYLDILEMRMAIAGIIF